MLGSRQYFVGQTQADSAVLATQHPATLPRAKSRHSDDYSGISTSDRQQLAEPATVPVKSLDQSDMSSQSIGQSYLLLDENAKEIRRSYMMVPSDVPSAEQAGGTTGLLSRIPLQRTASMVDRARREIGAGTSTSPLGGNSGLGQLPKVPEDGKRAASRKTLEEYQIENNHFRQIIDKLTQRLVTLEKVDTVLRRICNPLAEFTRIASVPLSRLG
eukprot:jgi/Hompol1/4518/HPOL_003689-RA